ncbi:hypothetical protein [Enterovirga aerilata]|uniref:SCP2 domain-containing protein n=1 Tax=Enterovirga aerilata TaxID=2730920 RepID=A0A849IG42_9HYPH|nr:hypothetical protein [Enterovirga sp. DB1703]NNM74917.1 hypothetical protein [Enterovirga sp. DB1703]
MSPGETRPEPSEADILERLLDVPELSRAAMRETPMRRFVDVECLVGTFRAGVHLSIRSGEVVAAEPGPILMRSWRFAYRATPEAWQEHWRSVPRAGFHDLLAMTKRRVATLEGDLHPFLANLQFFKDLLALPRAERPGGAA